MRFLFVIVSVFMIASCGLGSTGEVRPTLPPFMPGPPSGGPPEFREGWLDGCETGIAAHGNDFYRATFKFRQNPSLVTNPIYYKAWKDSENYCRTYIFVYSFRNMEPWCSVDGLTDDCAEGGTNSVPFIGQSTDAAGYGFLGNAGTGGGGVGSLMGGGDNFMGGNEDGITSVMGGW